MNREYLRDQHGLMVPADHLLTEAMLRDLRRTYPKAFSEAQPEPAPARREAPVPAEPNKLPPKVVEGLIEEFGAPEVHRALERAGLDAGPQVDALKCEAVSFEEAAHAVATDTVGCRVTELFMTRVGSGQCRFADLKPASAERGWRESLVRILAVYLAGQVAQQIKFGRLVVTGHDVDNAAIAKFAIVASDDERAEVLAEARCYTESLLRERWTEVELIATALRAEGTMSGERFYSLIKSRAEPATVERATPTLQYRSEMLPMMTRAATLRPSGDQYEVVFSTGAVVRRRDAEGESYDEQLMMGASNVDLSRLNAGAPLLASHDASNLNSIIGVVSNARIADGVGLARIRLSQRKDVELIVMDVRDQVLRNVSVGYAVLKAERIRRKGQVDLLRVTSWRPAELSLVAIGADPEARIKPNAPRFEAMVAA